VAWPQANQLLCQLAKVRRALFGPGLWPGPRRQAPLGRPRSPGSTARRRRVPRSGMRSTVEAGGADPDNAWRSGPLPVIFRPATGAHGATLTAWSCSCRAASGPLRRGPVAAGGGACRARQPPRRRATARRARAKLPPRNGETTGDPGR
jgi:hypothetical protein